MSSERQAFNDGFDKGFSKALDKIEKLETKNDQARAIMQWFVDKVDSGLARSTETYGEMTEWLKEN